MSKDISYSGSNTCNTKGDWLNSVNEYVYSDFFTLCSSLGNSWQDGDQIVNSAPIFVKEDNSVDFAFDTGIYKYEELMDMLPDNPTANLLKKCIKEKPYTKYIFIQVF